MFKGFISNVTFSILYLLSFLQLRIFISQGIHNRLQNEKCRLAAAITACETATASISRPGSPLEQGGGTEAASKENAAKIKLEDLIDQVRLSN